jgi:putative ABC transport system permease protein
MSTFFQDLRFAFRTLRKHWLVTVAAVVSLSLAIGGNTAVFSMVDAFLFRPLPFDHPERLVLFGERLRASEPGSANIGTSLATWGDLRERTRTLDDWAAIQGLTLSLRGEDRSDPVTVQMVTPNYFEMVGARMNRGRTFLPEEGVEGARRVVIVSEEFRSERWGDQLPLGEVLTLNSEPYEVVGVLPGDFAFFQGGVDLWVPLTRSPQSAPRDQRNITPLARMTPGATMEQVRGEVGSLAEQIGHENPETMGDRMLDAFNLRYDVPPTQARLLFSMMLGMVGVVLIIACVNITNLLLARSQERTREIALRTVLGAARVRVLRQLLTESMLMALLGGLGGIGLGVLGIDAMVRSWMELLPAGFMPRLDGRVLAFTLGITLGAGLLFGLAPAIQTVKRNHATALREGRGRSGGGGSRKRLSRILVVGEIALSMICLGTGSMLVRSFLEIRDSDPGFQGEDVLVASLAVPQSKYPEEADRRRLGNRIMERVRALPGIAEAALLNSLPQTPVQPTDSMRVPGEEPVGGRSGWDAVRVAASPGYLEVYDIPLLEGRFFQEADREDSRPVAAVNQELAQRRFPGESAVGRQLVVGGEEREIVGVVSDVQQQLISSPDRPGETVYVPQAQSPAPVFLVVEATGDPHQLVPTLREQLQLIDLDLTVSQALTMVEFVDQAFAGIRVFNVILGGFGIMALFLAALGTYGVLAYSVGQRRHEIGVRLAIGARPGSVVRMIATQGLWLGAIGLVLGLVGTLPLIGVLRSMVSAFATVKPSTLGFIAALLAGVTVLASWVPARRATGVDPVETLREE